MEEDHKLPLETLLVAEVEELVVLEEQDKTNQILQEALDQDKQVEVELDFMFQQVG